jgi:hypothetical protein
MGEWPAFTSPAGRVPLLARVHQDDDAGVARPAPGRFYLGASTMTIWRPSIEGSASTLAIELVSSFTRANNL